MRPLLPAAAITAALCTAPATAAPPTTPSGLRAEIYSGTAAELFRDRAGERGLSYEVTRGGRTLAGTDGTSAFLSGLPRTNGASFEVVAIDGNGRRSGPATITLGGPATGPDTGGPVAPVPGPAAPSPSGLPVVRTDVVTSNEVDGTAPSEAVRRRLPDDCLLTRAGPWFCYEAATRTFAGVLDDGTPFWSFRLPGDEASNRIEALLALGYGRLALVANTSTTVGEPRHEASFFDTGGAFRETRPLLRRTLNLAGEPTHPYPTVNLQREPLLVASNRDALDSTDNPPSDFWLAGNRYERIDGGDPGRLGDWRHVGVAIDRMSADGVTRLAHRFVPELLIADTAVDALRASDARDLELVVAGRTLELDRRTLAQRGAVPGGFDWRSAPLVVPRTLGQLRGESLVDLSNDVVRLNRYRRPEIELPDCAVDGLGACEDFSTVSRAGGDCVTGTYEIVRTFTHGFVPGFGTRTEDVEEYRFDACTSGFTGRLDGTLRTVDQESGLRQGTRRRTVVAAENLLYSTDEAYSRVTGSVEVVADGTSFLQRERSVDIAQLETGLPGRSRSTGEATFTPDRRVDDARYRSTTIATDGVDRFSESGGLRAELGDRDDPDVLRVDVELGNAYVEPDARLTGSVSFTAADGARLDILPAADPAALERERLDWTFTGTSGETRTATKPMESLFVPWW